MKGISWLNVICGAWLIIAPWVIGYSAVRAAATEDVVLGIAVVIISLWSLGVALTMSAPAWITLILGIWVLIAPWVIGYASPAPRAATNDAVLGILIIIFSAVRIASARRLAPAGTPPR